MIKYGTEYSLNYFAKLILFQQQLQEQYQLLTHVFLMQVRLPQVSPRPKYLQNGAQPQFPRMNIPSWLIFSNFPKHVTEQQAGSAELTAVLFAYLSPIRSIGTSSSQKYIIWGAASVNPMTGLQRRQSPFLWLYQVKWAYERGSLLIFPAAVYSVLPTLRNSVMHESNQNDREIQYLG